MKKYVNVAQKKRLQRPNDPAKRVSRYVRRSLAGTDGDYGPGCAAPDLEDRDIQQYQLKTKEFLDNLGSTAVERAQIAENTADDKEEWHRERRKRVTATTFHQIANMRDSTSNKNIMNRLLYDTTKDLDTPALQYGRVNEELAIQAYEKQTNTGVKRPVGLVVHPKHPFLAATPDGIVSDDIIVEVKCPKSAENTSLERLAASSSGLTSFFFLDDKPELKKSHQYYTQVQCQLACTGAKFCDFFVWTPNETSCQRIAADETFIANRLEKVKAFYDERIVPEMIDPRKARHMPLRERSRYREPAPRAKT